MIVVCCPKFRCEEFNVYLVLEVSTPAISQELESYNLDNISGAGKIVGVGYDRRLYTAQDYTDSWTRITGFSEVRTIKF